MYDFVLEKWRDEPELCGEVRVSPPSTRIVITVSFFFFLF